MCDFLFGKDKSIKIEFRYEGQVTYGEGKLISHNTTLNPYTYDLY